MTALTQGRSAPAYPGYEYKDIFAFQQKPGSVLYQNGLVCLDSSGLLVNATATTGLKCAGVAWTEIWQSATASGHI